MGIFGIAKKGFGKAVKAYKQTKIKRVIWCFNHSYKDFTITS